MSVQHKYIFHIFVAYLSVKMCLFEPFYLLKLTKKLNRLNIKFRIVYQILNVQDSVLHISYPLDVSSFLNM